MHANQDLRPFRDKGDRGVASSNRVEDSTRSSHKGPASTPLLILEPCQGAEHELQLSKTLSPRNTHLHLRKHKHPFSASSSFLAFLGPLSSRLRHPGGMFNRSSFPGTLVGPLAHSCDSMPSKEGGGGARPGGTDLPNDLNHMMLVSLFDDYCHVS